MLAYDYPAMGIFMSMFYFFIFFIWIMLLFRVFGDIFRSHDMGGFAKTLWVLFVILAPFLGSPVAIAVDGNASGEIGEIARCDQLSQRVEDRWS
jgi:hypothetical protein